MADPPLCAEKRLEKEDGFRYDRRKGLILKATLKKAVPTEGWLWAAGLFPVGLFGALFYSSPDLCSNHGARRDRTRLGTGRLSLFRLGGGRVGV